MATTYDHQSISQDRSNSFAQDGQGLVSHFEQSLFTTLRDGSLPCRGLEACVT